MPRHGDAHRAQVDTEQCRRVSICGFRRGGPAPRRSRRRLRLVSSGSASLRRSVICGASARRMSLQVWNFAPRAHDDSAEKNAALAGLSTPVDDPGNIEPEESALSHCLAGSPGRNRNHAKNIGNLTEFRLRLPSDTPRNTPSKRWLPADVVGCPFVCPWVISIGDTRSASLTLSDMPEWWRISPQVRSVHCDRRLGP